MNYPEHDKLTLVKERSQEIGQFLEWMQDEKEWVICEREPTYRQSYYPVGLNMNQLLAEYFEINLDVLEKEKLSMLEELRSKQ